MVRTFKLISCTLAVLLACLPSILMAESSEPPENIVIDQLTYLNEAAEFDHILHTDIAEDCTVCHHHTMGEQPSDEKCARCHASGTTLEDLSCRNCHNANTLPVEPQEVSGAGEEIYHVESPHLKAVYHMRCLGCHENDGGPTGCEDCHDRTEEGDRFYHSGSFTPEGEAGDSAH